jgi:hypothetical protein
VTPQLINSENRVTQRQSIVLGRRVEVNIERRKMAFLQEHWLASYTRHLTRGHGLAYLFRNLSSQRSACASTDTAAPSERLAEFLLAAHGQIGHICRYIPTPFMMPWSAMGDTAFSAAMPAVAGMKHQVQGLLPRLLLSGASVLWRSHNSYIERRRYHVHPLRRCCRHLKTSSLESRTGVAQSEISFLEWKNQTKDCESQASPRANSPHHGPCTDV